MATDADTGPPIPNSIESITRLLTKLLPFSTMFELQANDFNVSIVSASHIVIPLFLGLLLAVIVFARAQCFKKIQIATPFILTSWLKPTLPPGPAWWPGAGSIFAVQVFLGSSNPHQLLGRLADQYGPVIRIWVGPILHVIVSSSEGAREVLKDFDNVCCSRSRPETFELLSFGGRDIAYAPAGEYLNRVRKLCAIHLFTRKRIAGFRRIRMEELHALCISIRREASGHGQNCVTLRKLLFSNTLNNVMRIIVGRRFEASTPLKPNPEADDFFEHVTEGFNLGGSMNVNDYVPFLKPFDLQGITARAKKFVAKTTVFFLGEIEKHRKSMDNGDSETDRQDFCSVLLSLQEKEGLADTDVVAILQDMIFGGSESSSLTVEWALIELLRHPEQLKRLQEELDEALGPPQFVEDDFSDDESFELTVTKLPYLRAVMKETFRLHSVGPLLVPHTNIKQIALQDGKYVIPEGTSIVVNAWYISRDPSVWDDALEFKPERFLERDMDTHGTNFGLLPFGSGRRMCPGYALGEVMVLTMLATLVHKFDWSPGTEKLSVEEKFHLSMSPKYPLEAVVLPRW